MRKREKMRIRVLTGVLIVAAVQALGAPPAEASAPSLCDSIGGQWNGQYCHATVTSDRNAVREINIAIPAEIDNPAVAGPIADYLRTLMGNWRKYGQGMAQNSWGDANFETFRHGDIQQVVFHETYNSESTARLDGPAINSAYRTFAYNQATGQRVQLADLMDVNAIPALGAPFIQSALDQAAPPHQPNTYPFIADRWTPDKVYSGGYKAWALTPDELILYMPDYPVARDTPIDFTPGVYQWSMTGGTVQPHIPLSVLAPALRVA